MEFHRLCRARELLDAIALLNELLSEGSDVEILSLVTVISKRLKHLGISNAMPNKENETAANDNKSSFLKSEHSGTYHCCTFCSSGGQQKATCGCKGTIPGGYRGCGHGHPGHPGVYHWSCCGSILRDGPCLNEKKTTYYMLL